MKKILLLTLLITGLTACSAQEYKVSRGVQEEEEQELLEWHENENGELEVINFDPRYVAELIEENTQLQDQIAEDRNQNNKMFKVVELNNGKHTYIGTSPHYGTKIKYSIEYDPGEWEIFKQSESRSDAWLENKTDLDCIVYLAASPSGNPGAEIFEDIGDDITRMGGGDTFDYFTSKNDVIISTYIENESQHPECLSAFKEIVKTFTIEL